MRKIILFALLFINVFILKAQVSDTTNTNKEKTTNIQASLEYMNKAVFSGRNYMINGGLINPALSLNFKQGVSLEFTTFIMPNDTSKTKQSELGITYNNDLFDWWNIGGGYTLYRTSTTTSANKKGVEKTTSQSDNGISLVNTFNFDWMFMNNSINYFFGTQKGLDVMFMAGKDISLDDLTGIDDLSVSPTLTADIGNHFAKFRQIKNKLLSNVPTTTNSSKFQPLDYEISLPIEYELKGFTFNVTPAYAFPVNLLTSPIPALNESNLGNHFFCFSAKITYQFDFKKKY